jgi:hypothetical protein
MSEHNEIHSLPPKLCDLVERELEPDENFVWIGQPKPTFFVGGYGFLEILIGMNVSGGIIIWMCAGVGMGAPLWFLLLASPFLLIALCLLCSPMFTRRNLKNTIYAITDRRVIIFAASFFSMNIVSFAPNELGKLRRGRRLNGNGDIYFGDPIGKQPIPKKSIADGFYNLLQPMEVERLLKNLAAQTQEETTLEQLNDPPLLQRFGVAPRNLPISVCMYLRLCSTSLPLLGWLIAGLTLMFSLLTMIATFPEDMEQDRLKIVLFISLFAFIGLCFPISSWFAGGRAIRLLQYGIATKARFLGPNPTNENSEQSPKFDFEYLVDDQTYTVTAQAQNDFQLSRLTDTKSKVVFYDPMQPDRSVVLDGLPCGIQFDEWTGQFRVNPLCNALPLLAATIVCGEIIAIIVLAVFTN